MSIRGAPVSHCCQEIFQEVSPSNAWQPCVWGKKQTIVRPSRLCAAWGTISLRCARTRGPGMIGKDVMNPPLSLSQVDRYEEYPKMRELIQRKDSLVAQRATPPYFIQAGSCTLPVLWQPTVPCPKDALQSLHPNPRGSPQKTSLWLLACGEAEAGLRILHARSVAFIYFIATNLPAGKAWAGRAQSVSQHWLCRAGRPAGAQAGREDLRHQVRCGAH